MSMLSGFCMSKGIWPVRYGYIVWDDSNEWSFVGPDNEWYVCVPGDEWLIWVPDIDWRILGSTLDSL